MFHAPSTICRECGEDASSVFDHADDCEVAEWIAQNHIDDLEEQLGTHWETEKTEMYIEMYKGVVNND